MKFRTCFYCTFSEVFLLVADVAHRAQNNQAVTWNDQTDFSADSLFNVVR